LSPGAALLGAGGARGAEPAPLHPDFASRMKIALAAIPQKMKRCYEIPAERTAQIVEPTKPGWARMGRMSMMRKLNTGVVSSLALAVGLAVPAHAQDGGEAASGNRLSEIVVTAEFREANVQDTPIAITAVNSEMLEARGQTDIAQVASQAPNV